MLTEAARESPDAPAEACALRLIYNESLQSQEWARSFREVASALPYPLFTTTHASTLKEPGEIFSNTPPYILCYRQGQVIEKYPGTRTVQAILSYALSRACRNGTACNCG